MGPCSSSSVCNAAPTFSLLVSELLLMSVWPFWWYLWWWCLRDEDSLLQILCGDTEPFVDRTEFDLDFFPTSGTCNRFSIKRCSLGVSLSSTLISILGSTNTIGCIRDKSPFTVGITIDVSWAIRMSSRQLKRSVFGLNDNGSSTPPPFPTICVFKLIFCCSVQLKFGGH